MPTEGFGRGWSASRGSGRSLTPVGLRTSGPLSLLRISSRSLIKDVPGGKETGVEVGTEKEAMEDSAE